MYFLRFILLLSFLLLSNCRYSKGQSIPVVKINDVLERINRSTDTVLVLNFWATWCLPCVEELPGFIKLEKELEKEHVEFIYLSLDFKREAEKNLSAFLMKKEMTATVFLLDEPDYNSWIDRISRSWQGAIPATLIVDRKHKSKTFHEGELSYTELEKLIKKYLP